MNKQALIFGITFLFFFSIVSATQTSDSINIIYPKIDVYDHDKNISLVFILVNNSLATCSFNLYDEHGNVLLNGASLIPLNDKKYINLSTTTLNNTGKYEYNILCNTSNTYGYLSDSFFIKRGGYQPNNDTSMFISIILLPLLFAFLLVVVANGLNEGQGILKLVLILLTFPLFILSLNFAVVGTINFYELPAIEESITGSLQYMGWFYWAILAFILIMVIVMAFDYARGKKRDNLEY